MKKKSVFPNSILAVALRGGVCALLALCLAVPMPVLFPPVQAKAGVSALRPVPNFHGRHVHAFVRASSLPNADPPASIAPVPIPGGDVVPPLGGPIHFFFPGPTSIGNDGIEIEPSSITNFRGFTGVAMLAGTATDANGNKFDLLSDLRVYQGEYVSADGRHHRGTFVEI